MQQMMTRTMAIKTPGLMTLRGTQYWMTSAAAVSWFGVTMMYLNQYLVSLHQHTESVNGW